jgi:hypothetical protein
MVSEQFLKMTFCTVNKGRPWGFEGCYTPVAGVRKGPNPFLNPVVKFKAGRRPISLGRALLRVLKGDHSMEKPL